MSDSALKKLKTVRGLLVVLGFLCGLAGWILFLVIENDNDNVRYDLWWQLVTPLAILLNLAGFLLNSSIFFIAGAGILWTTASVAADSFVDPSFDTWQTKAENAGYALILAGTALSFVGYPFKFPGAIKIDVANLIAFLGIGSLLTAAILLFTRYDTLGKNATGEVYPLQYIFLAEFFIWGAYGGSVPAQTLTVFLGSSICSESLSSAASVSEGDSVSKASYSFGIIGTFICAALTLFTIWRGNNRSDDENPLLRG